jgi:thiol-disulfide isomerase/thioredoxin
LAAALLSCSFWMAGCSQRATPQVPAAERLPELTLTRLDDGLPSALERVPGRAVVLNFWATWCEPCRREMSGLQSLSDKSDPDRLAVIGISVDSDVNLAREFLIKHRLSFTNFIDHAGEASASVLGIRVLPQTLLVTADGTVAARITGAKQWGSEEGQRLLRAALTADGQQNGKRL